MTLILVAIAFWIRLLILPTDGRVIYSTFYPAIGLTTLLCGYRFGLLSTALGAIVAYWFLLHPTHSLKVLDTDQLTGLLTFIGAGIILCLSFTRLPKNIEAVAGALKPTTIAGKTIFTVFVIGFALLLRISLLSVESRVIYSTFYPAIAIVTLACGFRAGIASILLAGFLAYFFLLEPHYSFRLVINLEQLMGIATFFIASGIITFALREVMIRGKKITKVNERLQDLMTASSVGKSLEDLVRVIATTVDMRDPYTAGHQRRVSDLALAIGRRMGLPERQLMGIKLAGLIHDLGKMSIPLDILTKPGKLSDHEVALIREHPMVAYNALKDLQTPWPLADIVAQHHERFDGAGYPGHLAGEDILIEARILAVADVVEAMSAMRPYREGLGITAALAELRKNAGTKYDQKVVETCVALFESGEFSWEQSK